MSTSTPALQPARTSGRAATQNAAAGPARRTLLLLSATYCALFIGLFVSGGDGAGSVTTPGASVISQYAKGSAAVHAGVYGMVVAGALLIFWGCAVRRVLTQNGRAWTADAVLAGAVAFALTLTAWAVSALALYDAVQTGTPAVAQAMNVLDHANFVPAMLGLICTMVGAGIAGYRTGFLPRWLAIASVIIGAMAPLGPAGVVAFSLFPIWLVVVSACIRRAE